MLRAGPMCKPLLGIDLGSLSDELLGALSPEFDGFFTGNDSANITRPASP